MDNEQACHSADDEMNTGLLPTSPSDRKPDKRTGSKVPHHRMFTTISLVLLWVSLALTITVNSTSNVDFSEMLGENYGRIGMAGAVNVVCVLTGLFIGSLLTDRLQWSHELILGSTAIVMGLASIAKPFTPNLFVLATLFGTEGLAKGIAKPVANSLILGLWKEKAPVPVAIFHFGYGFGAIVGPFLAKPFLSQRCSPTEMDICQHAPAIHGIKYIRESRIVIPFTIAGIAIIIVGILFFVLYANSGGTQVISPASIKDNSDNTNDNKEKTLKFIMIALLICLYFTLADGGVGGQIFTISYESDLGCSKKDASGIVSTFYGCFTAGRLICAFVLQWLPVNAVFIFYAVGNCATMGGLSFFGLSSKTSLWLFTGVNALYTGPLWPMGLSWANQYIHLSTFAIAVIEVGACIGGIISTWLYGHLIDTGHIPAILKICFIFTCAMCLVILALYETGRRIGRKQGHNYS